MKKLIFYFSKLLKIVSEAISSFCSKKNINYEFIEENSIIDFEDFDNDTIQKFINEKSDKNKLFLFVKSEDKFFDQIATLKSLNLNLKIQTTFKLFIQLRILKLKQKIFYTKQAIKFYHRFLPVQIL